jgi:hypothetical protein
MLDVQPLSSSLPVVLSTPPPSPAPPSQVDLLVARKIKKAKSSYYQICTNLEDLSREGGNHFAAKLRANVLGTKFSVFDNGVSPSKRGLPEFEGYSLREELACVLYVRGDVEERGRHLAVDPVDRHMGLHCTS